MGTKGVVIQKKNSFVESLFQDEKHTDVFVMMRSIQ